MVSEKDVQTLRKAGLTSLQAMVYLTLIQTGKETVSNLSKRIDTDRSNVYQAISQLQKLGLLEETLGTINLWEAVPLKEGISALLRRKEEQYLKIQSELVSLLNEIHSENVNRVETSNFKILNFNKEKTLNEVSRVCAETKESHDILVNRKAFFVGVLGKSEDYLSAVNRGVKYRVIVEKSKNNLIDKDEFQSLVKEPNFQIRYVPFTPKVEVSICDNRVVWVPLLENAGIGEGFILFLSHPGCIEIFQNYFDDLWNQAEK